jgi:hypothetical protein
MRRPRPTPKKLTSAIERLTEEQLGTLAGSASYVGSGHHKDVPFMDVVPHPREGSLHIETAEAEGIDNPDCTLCPRKWARRGKLATELLRDAIRRGQVSSDAAPAKLPKRVWVRDPEDAEIVYEAKLLSHPHDGYKAYPLTSRQSRSLPLRVV